MHKVHYRKPCSFQRRILIENAKGFPQATELSAFMKGTSPVFNLTRKWELGMMSFLTFMPSSYQREGMDASIVVKTT